MHANEPVARERLIDELWGDAAPATVNSVLNVYLTRLRRLFADGGEVLATQPPGYVLRVPEERFDARRFQALLERGRDDLKQGDAEQAAGTLQTALALWRGPPLADLTYEPFAQNEIRRLEELRLAALEDRIDADLALARHDTLVAELETLVSEHPYRERLHGQLMVALYRAGRQAEALDAYRRAHRALVNDLGIEPGPRLQELERAILRHDPSLEAPPALPPPAVADQENGRQTVSRSLRRSFSALAIGLVAALAIVSGLVVAIRDGSGTPQEPLVLKGDSVAIIDPATTSVIAEIPIGARPSGIAVSEGSVWVANRDDNTLLRIDPRSRRIARTIGLPFEPREVAVAAEGVWVGNREGDVVLRVDPDVNDVVATIRLERSVTCCPLWLEVGGGAVWVSHGGRLSRIDPVTNGLATVRARGVLAIAYGEGDLWALTSDNRIDRIDPNTRAVVDSISRARVGQTDFGGGVAAGAGAVWTATYLGKSLWKIDPVTGDFVGSVQLGRPPAGVAFGHGSLWIPHGDATLRRVDPRSEKITHTIRLGVYVTEVAVGEGAVWIAVTR